MAFKPSTFQAQIFDWIQHGTGDAIVEAVAGSGKTTTAVKAMELIPATKRVLFLAFNKSIAEELGARAPKHADVRTLNGLGHRAWMSFAGRVQLEPDKTRAIMEEHLSEFEKRKYGAAVRKLVSVAKSQGLVPAGIRRAKGLIEDTDQNWFDLLDHFDIEPCNEPTDADDMAVIELARKVVGIGCEHLNVIDYDDQLYLPVAFGVSPPKYDWVFVDEAQDLSPVQWRLVEMARAEASIRRRAPEEVSFAGDRPAQGRGRIVAVGDSRQAIYGWRGADSNSMANFKKRTGATSLALSICYRCPKSHIAMAQAIVPQIQAAETADAGEVANFGLKWEAKDFQNDDLIICRNSAPLVKAAYRILAQKVAVRILGRDLGTGLVNLIRKLKPRSTDDLIERLQSWREKEVARLQRKDPDATSEKIDDKVDTIMTFIEMFPNKGPDGICREIENLYSDNTQGILTLSTVHKAKGLEANRVYILNQELMPSRQAKKPWQVEQEANLRYVALTRAKAYLGFIEIDLKKGRK